MKNIIFLCPSLGKECGIARYTKYIIDSFQGSSVNAYGAATTNQVNSIIAKINGNIHIIVQHEYGLFDYLNPDLSEGQTTFEVLSWIKEKQVLGIIEYASIVMHTLVTHDHVLTTLNKQIFSSGIRVFHLNSEGCSANGIEYLEHGFFKKINEWVDDEENFDVLKLERSIGAFGLLSENKKYREIIDLCAMTSSKLIGQFATKDKKLSDELQRYAEQKNIETNLYFDFADESEIIERMKDANMMVCFQSDIKHSATSGSIRFLMSLEKPTLANPVKQFKDLLGGLVLAEIKDCPEIIETLFTDSKSYIAAKSKTINFCAKNYIKTIYEELLTKSRTKSKHVDLYVQSVLSPSGNALVGRKAIKLNELSKKYQTIKLDAFMITFLNSFTLSEYLKDCLPGNQSIKVLRKLIKNTRNPISRFIAIKLYFKYYVEDISFLLVNSSTCEMIEFLSDQKTIYREQLNILCLIAPRFIDLEREIKNNPNNLKIKNIVEILVNNSDTISDISQQGIFIERKLCEADKDIEFKTLGPSENLRYCDIEANLKYIDTSGKINTGGLTNNR